VTRKKPVKSKKKICTGFQVSEVERENQLYATVPPDMHGK
jgi:hypothetical protein